MKKESKKKLKGTQRGMPTNAAKAMTDSAEVEQLKSKVRKLQTELRAVKKENVVRALMCASLKSECVALSQELEDLKAPPDATPENVPFAGEGDDGEGDDGELTNKEIEDEYDAKGTPE